MCSTKLSLEVFSRWFDYIMTEWTGMISLQSMYGGQSGFRGERGRLEGIHAHLKFKHGMKRKWERDALIEGAEWWP